MARPRTARSPEQTDRIADAGINHQALADAGQAATEHAQQLAMLDMQFALDGDQYTFDRIRMMTPAAIGMVSTGMLWLGRALILVEAHETRDTYQAYLEEFEIADRTARQYKHAARRFTERPKLIALGASKILALASESDDALDELEADDARLDEVDRMTVRELKATLRTERKERDDEKAADEEIIRTKDERINKLMRNNRKLETSSVRVQVDDLLRDMDEAAVVLAQQATLLTRGINDVRRAYDEAGEQAEPEVEARITQNIGLGAQWLRELAALDGE